MITRVAIDAQDTQPIERRRAVTPANVQEWQDHVEKRFRAIDERFNRGAGRMDKMQTELELNTVATQALVVTTGELKDGINDLKGGVDSMVGMLQTYNTAKTTLSIGARFVAWTRKAIIWLAGLATAAIVLWNVIKDGWPSK